MRHNAKVQTFGLASGPRKALLRGLVNSLVEHGRIKTTLAKAKELRRHVERAVTTSKDQTLHARRLLMARYPNEKTVGILMTDIAPRMKTRPGGYTRILKLGKRPGDNADMAFIEFVDYTPKAALTDDEVKAASKVKKAAGKKKAAKKKGILKKQGNDRRVRRDMHA
jgi:large subunit ribosomal protein L17